VNAAGAAVGARDLPPETTTTEAPSTTVVQVVVTPKRKVRVPTPVPPTTIPIALPGFGPNRIIYEAAGVIFSVAPEGGIPIPLLEAGSMPSWAPDRFSYVSIDATDSMIVRDRYNGTRTLSTDGHDTHPAWSPGGSVIAFTRYANNSSGASLGCCGVWLVNADGSNPHRIVDSICINGEPAWTPDGTQLVFWSSRNFCDPDNERGWGNYELFIVNADGSNLRKLDTLSNSGSPSVSPDGTRVAFSTDRDDHYRDKPGTWDIWTMNLDGSNQTRLTNFAGDETEPDWSPDGKRIVFHADRDNGGLFTMSPDGTDVHHIVTGPAKNPDWG
jgi:TolB protein